MNPYAPRTAFFFAAIILFLTSSALTADAQRRDFMTEAEIEVVRDAQDIDDRVEVITRMIDRRFLVLNVNVNGWKDAAKQSDVWGELPKGSRAELFNDIKRLLQKAVDDIDNLAANPGAAPIRDKGDKRAKKDPERFPNSVRNLAAAAGRYLGPLKSAMDKSESDIEKGSIIDSIELCDQIIEAVGKLPAEVKKTKN
ncbi:MAG: hypothetical protein HOP17_08700 [Acidobacteria bacterium]|nr:hypothetical protein [Acidobacteriota bacterium]